MSYRDITRYFFKPLFISKLSSYSSFSDSASLVFLEVQVGKNIIKYNKPNWNVTN